MKQKIVPSFLLAIIFLGVLGLPLPALMVEITLPDLIKQSPWIIEGEVLNITSFWNHDKTMIYTDVSITVFDRLKGPDEPLQLTVCILGGRVGDLGCRVSDVPEFFVGEHVLLFLNRLTAQVATDQKIKNRFEVTGLAQGKFSISAAGLASRCGYTLYPAPKDGQQSWPISELRALIARHLQK